jgi:hypothetical protein
VEGGRRCRARAGRRWRPCGPRILGIGANGEPVSISSVFRMALPFEEPMPEVLFQDLIAYAARSLERETDEVELSRDRSYASGARCLLRWVRENNSKFFGT